MQFAARDFDQTIRFLRQPSIIFVRFTGSDEHSIDELTDMFESEHFTTVIDEVHKEVVCFPNTLPSSLSKHKQSG